MIHAKSYNAAQITNETNPKLRIYRVGLRIKTRDDKSTFLRNINEAVTVELTKKCLLGIINDPIFYGEDEQKEKFKNGKGFGYPRQREILKTLIDKIYGKNPGKFKNKDEVFDLFAEGAVTGNILPLGRVIEKTFGKKTLRKIGELDEDIEKLKEFINSLSGEPEEETTAGWWKRMKGWFGGEPEEPIPPVAEVIPVTKATPPEVQAVPIAEEAPPIQEKFNMVNFLKESLQITEPIVTEDGDLIELENRLKNLIDNPPDEALFTPQELLAFQNLKELYEQVFYNEKGEVNAEEKKDQIFGEFLKQAGFNVVEPTPLFVRRKVITNNP
jgi:hypothetical protein